MQQSGFAGVESQFVAVIGVRDSDEPLCPFADRLAPQ
jgi:hypothetical protein